VALGNQKKRGKGRRPYLKDLREGTLGKDDEGGVGATVRGGGGNFFQGGGGGGTDCLGLTGQRG